MKNNLYIAYYRVSTVDQGKSGLGLEAQRKSVMEFINSNGTLVNEFQDIESGASETREGIKKAIELCKATGATLVVKEMSRISRGGFKIMVEMEEAGVDFIESTAPHDASMVKGLKFVLAKDEREKISERTTSALSRIKDKIKSGEQHISKAGNVVTHLGSPENLTDEARQKSIEVRQRKAMEDENNKKSGAFILSLHKNGKSFKEITEELNRCGFKTRRGCEFSVTQVRRLFNRYKK